MKNLTNEELKNINGWWVNIGLLVGIADGLKFIFGLIDGIIRPLKCNYEIYERIK